MRPKRDNVTLRDVALKAGVSVATVSYALNSSRGVGPELRDRVLVAAESLGYRANVLAQGLRAGSAKLVACIVSNLSNPLIAAAVESANRELAKRGYGTLIFRAGVSEPELSNAVTLAASYRAAGLLVIHPFAGRSRELQRWIEDDHAVTIAIHPHSGLYVDQVLMAGEDAARRAVRHLLHLGHRDIALVARSLSIEIYADVARGYQSALADAGLALRKDLLRSRERATDAAPETDLGYRETKALLKLSRPPTAIIGAHNKISIGVLRALHDEAVRVPEDMSIVSFDRMDWMTITHPNITSIGIDGTIIGVVAAKSIVSRMEGKVSEPSIIKLPLQLSVGASVKKK